jgi:hypothetical protein
LCRFERSGIVLRMHSFLDLSKGAKILLILASLVVLAEGAYLYRLQTKPLMNSCQYMIAAWEKAEPEAAAAKEAYTGPIANVNFESPNFPQAKQFASVISEAVAGGPNFAGHFAIAEIGCGTNCQNHAIVDVITGNIIAFGIPSEAGLRFAKESAIIVTNPAGNVPALKDIASLSFDEKRTWFNTPREYYVVSEKDNKVTTRRICIENAYDGQLR